LVKIRVHVDSNTAEGPAMDLESAKNSAEYMMNAGAWVGNKLYPPHAIIYIELIEVQ
jgi:hypothetical protein